MVEFLDNYWKPIVQAKRYSSSEMIKGNVTIDMAPIKVKVKPSLIPVAWPPPLVDRVALSVDGSFSSNDGSAANIMILRRASGTVVFAAYHVVFKCNDGLEAEIHALM